MPTSGLSRRPSSTMPTAALGLESTMNSFSKWVAVVHWYFWHPSLSVRHQRELHRRLGCTQLQEVGRWGDIVTNLSNSETGVTINPQYYSDSHKDREKVSSRLTVSKMPRVGNSLSTILSPRATISRLTSSLDEVSGFVCLAFRHSPIL